MKDKILFFALIICIIMLTFIHNPSILTILSCFFVLLSYKTAFKAIRAILLFNLSITVGVIIKSFYNNQNILDYLILFNARVFDITFITIYISNKINIIQAVSFSKSLRFLLSSTLSQIQSFQRTYDDLILSLKSRTIKKMKERKQKEFLQSIFYLFFKKALHNSKERSMALKARGFFD